MRRLRTLLTVACAVCAVIVTVAFFEFVMFAHNTLLDQIEQNPTAWLGKTIVVEGNLSGPYTFIPESAPSFNCLLETSNGGIGVLWHGWLDSDPAYVRVVGIVRAGKGEDESDRFYIEAQSVLPALNSTP